MKKLLFTILFTSLFFGSSSLAYGAELYFSSQDNVRVGNTFEVSVLFDTGGESVNAADIEISFNQNLLTFAGYKESEGVLGFWIERPHIENGKIRLTGVIPGGVTGSYDPNKNGQQPVSLAKIIFTAKSTGVANLYFTKSQILKNDGLGTELNHTKKSKVVSIYKKSEEIKEYVEPTPQVIEGETPVGTEVPADTESPDKFVLEYFESSLFLRTPSMLTFYGYDAGSGVARYEMKIGNKDWRVVESPYNIGESLFKRQVTVRAYDHSGNFKDSTIVVPGSITLWVIVIFITLTLFAFAVYEFLLIYHRRKRKGL